MIITLDVSCVHGPTLREPCVRTIEVDDEASLYDLHEAIQDAVDFGRDHPYHFFLAHSGSGQRHWLWPDEDYEAVEAKYFRTLLREVFPTGQKKLFYLFDLGDDWTFQIRKRRGSRPAQVGVRYPRLIALTGGNPIQYPVVE